MALARRQELLHRRPLHLPPKPPIARRARLHAPSRPFVNRPANRKNRQSTAMHTQTTSTPILSLISRDLSYVSLIRATLVIFHTSVPVPPRSSPSCKSLQSCKSCSRQSTQFSRRSLVISYNARHLSYERTCPAEVSSCKSLQSCKSCSRQSTQFSRRTLVISRTTLMRAHLSRRGLPHPANLLNPANPAPDSPLNSLVDLS